MVTLPYKKKYRYIKESSGGTYTISPDARFIGTDGCVTCLGVYFAIDTKRCFLAHINIEPRDPDLPVKAHEERSIRDYQIGTAAERAIVWWVKRRLADEQWSADWGPVTKLMRDSLVVVCPQSNVPGVTYVGDAALAGVKELLGIDDPALQPRREDGFVVTHTGEAHPHVEFLNGWQTGWARKIEPITQSEEFSWGWANVRHDGTVWTPADEGGDEGPYHTDSA